MSYPTLSIMMFAHLHVNEGSSGFIIRSVKREKKYFCYRLLVGKGCGILIVTLFWSSKQHKSGFACVFFKIAGSIIITGEAYILHKAYWGCEFFVTRKVFFCICDRDLYKNIILRIN